MAAAVGKPRNQLARWVLSCLFVRKRPRQRQLQARWLVLKAKLRGLCPGLVCCSLLQHRRSSAPLLLHAVVRAGTLGCRPLGDGVAAAPARVGVCCCCCCFLGALQGPGWLDGWKSAGRAAAPKRHGMRLQSRALLACEGCFWQQHLSQTLSQTLHQPCLGRGRLSMPQPPRAMQATLGHGHRCLSCC